nr:hypothetical protein [Tanacetum cinerariifolium]
MMNSEKLMKDQNQLQDEPSPSRRRYQQLAIQPMDTLSGSYLTQPTFPDPTQAIVIEQVQTFDGSSTCEYHHNQAISTSTNDFRFSSDVSCSYLTNLNSMASTNAFQQAYNSCQDSEHPQATLQSFLGMEWTEDDISKEIEENLDEENMSPRSSIDVLQEAKNYYQSFHAQLTKLTQDYLDNLLMENLEEVNLSPRSSINVIQQAYNLSRWTLLLINNRSGLKMIFIQRNNGKS